MSRWLRDLLVHERETRLAAYSVKPDDLQEHCRHERIVIGGGYGDRLVYELIQNGVDAMLEQAAGPMEGDAAHRMQIVLANDYLYAANTGAPLSKEGAKALLSFGTSPKWARVNAIGRFGLGFKSILTLGGVVDVVTRDEGVMRFDPGRSRKELEARFGQKEELPDMRLAWHDERSALEGDGVLNRLGWAETVIRAEIKNEGVVSALQSRLRRFPPEFLIFVDRSVTLDFDLGNGEARSMHATREDDIVHVEHSGDRQSWRRFSTIARITDEAATRDGTEYHARDSVPIVWAVPVGTKSAHSTGLLWAFAPTQTRSHLGGIVNAPWKVNSDRTAVIEGAWTGALFERAADLIVASLPQLSAQDDPGVILDSFPRKVDGVSDIAAPLVEACWDRIVGSSTGMLPDMNGILREVASVRAHPVASADAIEAWGALASAATRSQWVHPTCMDGVRRSRLDELRQRLQQPTTSVFGWLDAVAKPDIAVSAALIRLVDEVYRTDRHPEVTGDQYLIGQRARVILGVDGRLHTAHEVHLSGGMEPTAGLTAVHPQLSADAQLAEILRRRFSVKSMVVEDWYRILNDDLSSAHREAVDAGSAYSHFLDPSRCKLWQRIQECPSDVARKWACESMAQLPLRRMDGRWGTLHDVLLPSQLARDIALKDVGVLLDAKFHASDKALIEVLAERWLGDELHDFNMSDSRRLGGCPKGMSDWAEFARREWRKQCRAGAHDSFLEGRGVEIPCGLSLLCQTSGTLNAHLTLDCLRRWVGGGSPSNARINHTASQSRGSTLVVHPAPWAIWHYGSLAIRGKVVPMAAIVDRRTSSCLSAWEEWPNVEGWVEALASAAGAIMSPASKDQLDSFWDAVSELTIDLDGVDAESTARLWKEAAQDGYVPSDLQLGGSSWRQAGAFVTTSAARLELASKAGMPCLLLPLEVESLWLGRGSKAVEEALRFEVSDVIRSSGQLSDMFPELAEVDEDSDRPVFLSSPADAERPYYVVEYVRLRAGMEVIECACEVVDGAIYASVSNWTSMTRQERLRHALFACGQAGWLRQSPENALQRLEKSSVDTLRALVREATSLAERLLRCVGGRSDVLRSSLGDLGHDDAIRQLSDRGLADLVLAQLGPSTLSTPAVYEAMQAEGLDPPHRWGSPEAIAFCDAIGFPENFSGSASERRASEEWVIGPIPLPALHDYQMEVCDSIESLVGQSQGRRRAVVRLPTGGGKTRVAVEALIRHVLNVDVTRPYVLWIAQTDELCEQAVQAFMQVWANVGSERVRLRIGRMWGGQRSPAPPTGGSPLVIVASIQTLAQRMDDDALRWLGTPSAFVIDECHHADAPTYRQAIKWIESCAAQRSEVTGSEPMFLGLSATPFRMDPQSSARLAQRFDQRIMPADQADLDRRLIERGMLARVHAERIESQASVRDDEIESLSRAMDQGDGVKIEQILQRIDSRLANDEVRNSLIVSRVKETNGESVLLFANSVAHARVLAARLHLDGVPAVAISGETPPSTRRCFLRRFQDGQIRVICNHSVLSTGFDAPKVSVIVISRQVVSPVRYLQIVGRGLRGVRNGGTEVCRVLTVMDNLKTFSDKHAYHYFQRYYQNLAAPSVALPTR